MRGEVDLPTNKHKANKPTTCFCTSIAPYNHSFAQMENSNQAHSYLVQPPLQSSPGGLQSDSSAISLFWGSCSEMMSISKSRYCTASWTPVALAFAILSSQVHILVLSHDSIYFSHLLVNLLGSPCGKINLFLNPSSLMVLAKRELNALNVTQ